MKYFATTSEETFLVERTTAGVTVDDREVSFEVDVLGPGEALFRLAGRSARVIGVRQPGGWRIRVAGRDWLIDLETERARAIRELTGHDDIAETADLRAPMPGLVVKVMAQVGQVVEAGDGLVVVEAMKMENELRAVGPGTIASIDVVTGSTVDRDEVLIRFEDGG